MLAEGVLIGYWIRYEQFSWQSRKGDEAKGDGFINRCGLG